MSSDYTFDPDNLVTLPASDVHGEPEFIVEGCTGCNLAFEKGETFNTFLNHSRGWQALCEVCYNIFEPNKHENANATIMTRLILREIRKHGQS